MATGRRRGRAIIYIALILILLLVLVFALARFYLPGNVPVPANGDPAQGEVVVATPTQIQNVENIVVTTQDVVRGQVLSDDLLAVVAIPREQYTDGVFFRTKEEVLGARARMDMTAHTPVTNALIVPPGSSGSILSFEIPAGKVAISIPVSKLSSLSYGLQKGDRVNVITSLMLVDLDTNFQARLPNRTGVIIAPGPINEDQTNVTTRNMSPPGYDVTGGEAFSYYGRVEVDPTTGQPVFLVPSEAQRPRLVSQTLIQDVVVLQVGTYAPPAAAQPAQEQEQVQDPNQPQQAQPTQAVEAPQPEVVTLIVDPQDAVSLNYLMLSGASLNLVLRGAADDSRFNTEAATLQFIRDQYQIPNPAKLPYGTEPRMDQFPSLVNPFPDAAPRPTPIP
jgi:Flp pilus assembly protein CpaB